MIDRKANSVKASSTLHEVTLSASSRVSAFVASLTANS